MAVGGMGSGGWHPVPESEAWSPVRLGEREVISQLLELASVRQVWAQ